MSNARHSSEGNEHYTPSEVVAAARATLDVIDLDPASCAAANKTVGALEYYTKEQNGLMLPWTGNVFVNPPGGWCDNLGRQVVKRTKDAPPCSESGACGLKAPHVHDAAESSQKRWWQELVANWAAGDVWNAIFVCFSIELLQTTQVDAQGPIPLDFPICYPARRVAYTKEDGTVGRSPPHASAIICVSRDPAVVARFKKEFSPLGRVVEPK